MPLYSFVLPTDVRNTKAADLAFADRVEFGFGPAVLDLAREDTGGGVVASP